jgi:hypothetical protein
VETYEEWRLIFEAGHADGLDAVIEEATGASSDEVDIHRAPDDYRAGEPDHGGRPRPGRGVERG